MHNREPILLGPFLPPEPFLSWVHCGSSGGTELGRLADLHRWVTHSSKNMSSTTASAEWWLEEQGGLYQPVLLPSLTCFGSQFCYLLTLNAELGIGACVQETFSV